MTRLEKDAIKRLIILGAAFIAVSTVYFFSRQIYPSMAGFALMGLLGFVGRSKGEGPELDEEKLEKTKKWLIIPIIFILIIFGFQYKNIFLQTDKSFDLNFGAIISAVLILICILFLILKRKKVFIKKTIKFPKYDEREVKTLKNACAVAFSVFWLIFVLASISVSMSIRDRQLPTDYLILQLFVSWWVYTCAYNIAILWQERKLNNVRN